MKHIVAATIGLKGLGGLLFILSSSFGAYLLVCTQYLLCYITFFFIFNLHILLGANVLLTLHRRLGALLESILDGNLDNYLMNM